MTTPTNQPPRSPDSRPKTTSQRTTIIAWCSGAALVGLLAGFLLQSSRINDAQESAAKTNQALQAARLEASLSGAVIEAQSGRYEAARQRASDFYTGLQRRMLPDIATAQQAEARTMLGERDSVITALARNDPASAGTLAATLVRLRETIRAAGLDSTYVADER